MVLLPVASALERILAGTKPLPAERIPLDNALGRVLAQRIIAKRNQPPFPASAMDGYAIKHNDLAVLPAQLRVVGTSAAGHAFGRTLASGQAVRILTGAPLPAGADTVVIQENVTADGSSIFVNEAPPKGKNIRKAGLDFLKGDVLLSSEQRLRPRDIGLAAAGNIPSLRVYRRPHIVLFTTGDELVLPGQKAGPYQIYSSNSHALAAQAESLGAKVTNLGIVKDDLRATVRTVKKGLAADIVLTTGGASVGDHDYVQEAFTACGVKIDFWKIAMRPGKPFMYGRKGKTHVLGLPGNPVSALVTAHLFLRPLVNRLQGLTEDDPPALARLSQDMGPNDSRQDYVRATLEVAPDGVRTVTPFSLQDSSMQRTLQLAHCLIIRPPHAEAAPKGSLVSVALLNF